MADDNGPGPEAGEGDLSDRVDRLESGQSRILSKLDQLLGGGSRQGGSVDSGDEAGPGGRPPSIEEQVRAELQRADAERKQQADAEAQQSEAEQIKAQLAKLTEVKPAQPQPRRQRMMWGKHS